MSPSNTGGKPGSSFTQRLDEEQFSLSKPSKALHKESPGKSSGKARSVGRGIIEYSSRELQEKTLQQVNCMLIFYRRWRFTFSCTAICGRKSTNAVGKLDGFGRQQTCRVFDSR